jgi:branched-subunit amino acid transport protein
MDELYLVGGMAAVTFLIRYVMHPVSGKMAFPPVLERILAYVPPAVLTAIILPAVIFPSGPEAGFSLDNPYLVGAVGAFAIGWVTRNLLVTIVAGMGVFFAWQWLMPLA